jgi:hypothetical protein
VRDNLAAFAQYRRSLEVYNCYFCLTPPRRRCQRWAWTVEQLAAMQCLGGINRER